MPDSATVGSDVGTEEDNPRPSRRRLMLLVIPIIGLIVASNVGDALATTLAPTHPLTLVFLNSRSRNLVLVTNQLDAFSYYAAATLRLLVSDPLFFLLGAWYGDSAVKWMEKRTRSFGRTMRQIEGWFGRGGGAVLVFVAPNNLVCLLAGAAGMRVGVFIVANLAGTLTRLYLIRRVGETFESPIEDFLGFLSDYRIPLLILSLVLVAASSLWELRRGEGEIEAVLHIDEDLDPAGEPDPGL